MFNFYNSRDSNIKFFKSKNRDTKESIDLWKSMRPRENSS